MASLVHMQRILANRQLHFPSVEKAVGDTLANWTYMMSKLAPSYLVYQLYLHLGA